MSSVRLIAVINQKGGVGKTTTTANLAHGLSRKGFSVLAIDLDPQSHLAASLGITRQDLSGLDVVFLKNLPLKSVEFTVRENLKLIPAGAQLNDVENLDQGGKSRGLFLKNAIDRYEDQVDFILIDSPPSSGLLVINALFAVEEIIIPMTGDYLALQGLSHLLATLNNFEHALRKKYKQWIVLTRFHDRRRLSHEVSDKLLNYFPDTVFRTSISEAASIAECPGFGKTIFEYKPKSKSAQEYESLVDDLLEGRTR